MNPLNPLNPIIIIPAYNPDDKLVTLIEQLKKMFLQIIVVNDGSDQNSKYIFDMLENKYFCEVYTHTKNYGKGAALKTGIRYAIQKYPVSCGCITADADGQHAPEDILKIYNLLKKNPDNLILGIRSFSNKDIPFKSKWGNRITSSTFLLSTGKWCPDTQTGLRGIPKKFYDTCLNVPGNKYEYELNLLLKLAGEGTMFINVPITTIYYDNNKSSHFKPVKDSLIIYFNIIKYSLSSLISAIFDLLIFSLYVNYISGAGTTGILTATVIARILSGILNFSMNKHWVFLSNNKHSEELVKYITLFCSQMFISWLCVTALKNLPVPITLIKIAVDTILFFISYKIQHQYIFKRKSKECF